MAKIVEDWINKQDSKEQDVFLSIIIPAFNERWRLPTTLIEIVDFFDQQPQFSYEVIVVDDGSTDDTDEIVRKFEKVRQKIKLIKLPLNQGKGFAVKMGMLNGNGQRLLFLDADGSTPIAEFTKLNKELDNGFDIAIGSRAKKSSDTAINTVWYRKFMGRVFNFFVNSLLIPEIEDTQCGFKLFNKKSVNKLFRLQRSKGFSFDIEILFLAKKLGLKVSEVAINWQNVPGSKVNLVVDSTKMFFDIFRFRIIHSRTKRVKSIK